MGEMDKFRELGKELQQECKSESGGMARNFCVLTMEAALLPNGKWTNTYTNHRVLVGPEAKCKTLNAKIKDKLANGFTFKVNEQIHGQ